MKPKTRVLVVDDSLTVRKRIVEVLESSPDFDVVGEAADGRQAIELCERLRPDVVTLDMILPVMSGLAATEYIMAYFPTPILIVSASTNRSELFQTYDALAAGAVDVLEKPREGESDEGWASQLLQTLRLVSRIRVITHPRGKLAREAAPRNTLAPPSSPRRVVALGASTGGPGAVAQVLRCLPLGSVPIVLVIHIGETFAAALADWLAAQSSWPVELAVHGRPLPEGRVTLAPPGRHLAIRDGSAVLTSAPERHSCRPSIDVLFESVALDYGPTAIGCLLTGMGRDGAAGLLAIRRAGGLTIAQDESTSVVYGMPREAALLGAASQVVPLPGVGNAILSGLAAREDRR